MTTSRAAKYLNGADIGKKLSIDGWTAPRTILGINHFSSRVEIACPHPDLNVAVQVLLLPYEEVTIHTPPSPTSDDPHGINTRKADQ